MKNSVKVALGGMCIALTAAIMLTSAIIPVLTYAIPAICSLLVYFILIECDFKWALAVYFGASVVCALVVPEKEAVGMYIALLGYYPVLKTVLDKPKRIISVIIKSVYFIVVIVAAYTVMMRIFGISTDLLEDTGKWMIPVLVVLGLVAFLLYDFALGNLEIAYHRKWRRKVQKIIKRR